MLFRSESKKDLAVGTFTRWSHRTTSLLRPSLEGPTKLLRLLDLETFPPLLQRISVVQRILLVAEVDAKQVAPAPVRSALPVVQLRDGDSRVLGRVLARGARMEEEEVVEVRQVPSLDRDAERMRLGREVQRVEREVLLGRDGGRFLGGC